MRARMVMKKPTPSSTMRANNYSPGVAMRGRGVVILGLGMMSLVLAGCHVPSLEEARAACEAKGGQLVVLYSQRITLAGPEPAKASPGDCFMPDRSPAK